MIQKKYKVSTEINLLITLRIYVIVIVYTLHQYKDYDIDLFLEFCPGKIEHFFVDNI